MNREEITRHVLDFIRPRYYKQVDTTDADDVHFIGILAECAEYVLSKYKEKEENHDRRRTETKTEEA